MYTECMNDFFALSLLTLLTFVIPIWMCFTVFVIYLLGKSKRIWMLGVLGLFIDIAYAAELSVFGINFPLYTSISLLSLPLLTYLSKRLSLSSNL